ncbi:response regulator [Qipengyuania spongiae]|uniref:Response regulator n=1 Tax=Qipengyuania spongiae TaxID=2909673 RepID=A0ABY5T0D4_9SPHN|nr:response regulator [Qipengyuania spongiae]
MVENAGFEAVEAFDVDDAIRILESRTDIRIVYMDLDMPRGIPGIELAATIRDRWPPIAIILIAAMFKEKNPTLWDRAEFFAKPFRRGDVLASIERLMESQTA